MATKSTPQDASFISAIPPELLSEIILFLSPSETLRLSLVCKQFRDAIQKYDERIWKNRIFNVFPHISTSITLQELAVELSIMLSDLYMPSWKCIFFYMRYGVFRFSKSETEDVFISQDRTVAKTGIFPIPKLTTHFRVLLLEPGIPRNSTGIYQVHINIDVYGAGLWIGVSRKKFYSHTWLGQNDDSWGWGNECKEFYFQLESLDTDLGCFGKGDIVSMKMDMNNKTLQYFKNGNPGCLLDLKRITGKEELHFAVALCHYPMQLTLLPSVK